MSARTMKIAFVMEMADDGVTDVPSADAPDGLTDGTGRRERRIMCDKSQRRAKANRSSKKGEGDLFVCPISNGQSERESASISSALYASDTVCVCVYMLAQVLALRYSVRLGLHIGKAGECP